MSSSIKRSSPRSLEFAGARGSEPGSRRPHTTRQPRRAKHGRRCEPFLPRDAHATHAAQYWALVAFVAVWLLEIEHRWPMGGECGRVAADRIWLIAVRAAVPRRSILRNGGDDCERRSPASTRAQAERTCIRWTGIVLGSSASAIEQRGCRACGRSLLGHHLLFDSRSSASGHRDLIHLRRASEVVVIQSIVEE